MKTPLEVLADELGMPADHVREAAENIRHERMKRELLAKVQLIRERNTAILPTGEIVARGTPGAMPYEPTDRPTIKILTRVEADREIAAWQKLAISSEILRKKAESALAEIAKQNLRAEMDDHTGEHADWEFGYEACVRIAREALDLPTAEQP